MTDIYKSQFIALFEAIKKINLERIDEILAHSDAQFKSCFIEYIKEEEPTKFRDVMRPASNDNETNTDLGCAVLKHFNFEHQLCILEDFLTPKVQYFQSLLQTPDVDIPKILESRIFQYEIATCFHQEDFESIEELNQLFDVDTLTYKTKYGCYYLEVKVGSMSTFKAKFQKFDNAVFAPYYNIIVDYSPEKEAYLLSKGITLPSVEIAQEFASAIIDSMKGNSVSSEKAQAYETIHNYIKLTTYNEMQASLPLNNKTTRHNKI